MCLIVSNKVEFMAHCELTQEVGHEHHCIDIGVNHAVDHRGTKYSTVHESGGGGGGGGGSLKWWD